LALRSLAAAYSEYASLRSSRRLASDPFSPLVRTAELTAEAAAKRRNAKGPALFRAGPFCFFGAAPDEA
jgi:hypothetical protein